MRNPKSRWVVFDGPNGAGKTTLLGEVESRLRKVNRSVVVTREPAVPSNGIMALGERILMEHDLSPTEEAALFGLLRYYNEGEFVLPALARPRPTIVLQSRGILSSMVYQYFLAGDVSSTTRSHVWDIILEGRYFGKEVPDLVVICCVDKKTVRDRIGVGYERIERSRSLDAIAVFDEVLKNERKIPRRFVGKKVIGVPTKHEADIDKAVVVVMEELEI